MIVKNSFFIFILLFILSIIVSILLHSISYALGFLLGYCINLLRFKLTGSEVDLVLDLGAGKTAGVLAFFLYILKYALYALGFLMAMKLPKVFSFITVFFGYFVIKLSIFYSGYRTRKG